MFFDQVCCQGNHNMMQCCNEGVIGAVLNILKREKQISKKAVLNLIAMIESLGNISITSSELKQLVSLMKPDEGEQNTAYGAQLMHTMSGEAYI